LLQESFCFSKLPEKIATVACYVMAQKPGIRKTIQEKGLKASITVSHQIFGEASDVFQQS